MKSEVTVPLSRPIQAHGEEVTALTLREPTGKDLRIHGLPYRATQDGEIVVDAGAMARLMVELAGVPLSSIDRLSAVDFQAVTGAIMGFFQPAPAAGSAALTSS